jgi:hypothetical protein
MGDLLQPWHLIVLSFIFLFPFFVLLGVIPYWVIFKKAGFNPLLSLLMLIPVINLIVLFVVAFSDWKVAPVPQPVYESPVFPPQPPPQA